MLSLFLICVFRTHFEYSCDLSGLTVAIFTLLKSSVLEAFLLSLSDRILPGFSQPFYVLPINSYLMLQSHLNCQLDLCCPGLAFLFSGSS